MDSNNGQPPVAYSGVAKEPIYPFEVEFTRSYVEKAGIVNGEQERVIRKVLGSEISLETLHSRSVERV